MKLLDDLTAVKQIFLDTIHEDYIALHRKVPTDFFELTDMKNQNAVKVQVKDFKKHTIELGQAKHEGTGFVGKLHLEFFLKKMQDPNIKTTEEFLKIVHEYAYKSYVFASYNFRNAMAKAATQVTEIECKDGTARLFSQNDITALQGDSSKTDETLISAGERILKQIAKTLPDYEDTLQQWLYRKDKNTYAGSDELLNQVNQNYQNYLERIQIEAEVNAHAWVF